MSKWSPPHLSSLTAWLATGGGWCFCFSRWANELSGPRVSMAWKAQSEEWLKKTWCSINGTDCKCTMHLNIYKGGALDSLCLLNLLPIFLIQAFSVQRSVSVWPPPMCSVAPRKSLVSYCCELWTIAMYSHGQVLKSMAMVKYWIVCFFNLLICWSPFIVFTGRFDFYVALQWGLGVKMTTSSNRFHYCDSCRWLGESGVLVSLFCGV